MPIALDRLTLASGRCVYRHQDNPFIQVREMEGVRWLHFGGPAIQTAMSVTATEQLVLPYARAMLSAFLFKPQCQSLLNLGAGGGAFERFFRHQRPSLAVTSVELDPVVIDIARRFFQLDEAQYTIWQGSAGDYLRQHSSCYDMIFCDIFLKEGLPPCLRAREFHEDLAAHLHADGVLAVNLLVKDAAEMLEVLRAAYPSFATLALLDVPEDRNIILLATKRAATPIAAETVAQLAMEFAVDMPLLQGLMRFIPKPGAEAPTEQT